METSLEQALDLVRSVGNSCDVHDPSSKRKDALACIESLIDGGMKHLHVLYALLCASDDWTTFRIVRPELFRTLLLQGIDEGCLTPDHDEAWQWLELAAENNAPEQFMEDLDRFYDLLFEAMVEGNTIARDIMNEIWEPEQLIEED